MTWIKLDTKFLRHPKFASLTPLQVVFWVAGLAHSSDFRSDGWIPKGALPGLLPGTKRPQKAAEALVTAGLWEERDGGYQIHDYGHYQRSSAQIAADENGGPSRARAGTRSRGRARAQARPPEDVDVDTDKTPPHPPKGGRTREHLSYEGKLAEWSVQNFPGVHVGYIAHHADILRRQGIEPTVEALAPLLEPYGPKLL